ncbi:MAG TPA: hypothetical protein VK963_03785 [Candidatus Saccharimonadales bacterium]|nr:hypothetical protein [Candidatus Saccharimonadales bacterium]
MSVPVSEHPQQLSSRLVIIIHAEAYMGRLTQKGQVQAGLAAEQLVRLPGDWQLLSARDVWEQLTTNVIRQAAAAVGWELEYRVLVCLGQHKAGTAIMKGLKERLSPNIGTFVVMSARSVEKLLAESFSYCLSRHYATPGSIWEVNWPTGECWQVWAGSEVAPGQEGVHV